MERMEQHSASLRLLGLTMEQVADFRSRPHTKSGGLYAALDRRFDVVDIVQPRRPTFEKYLNKARHFHLDREYWNMRQVLNPQSFRRRSQIAEHELEAYRGRYDLIVQLHTILAPSLAPETYPYVIHTDNTYRISERFYRPWAPMRGKARADWVEMETRTYQHAAFLFPRSEFVRRSMIEDYGCDPNRVVAVGGGANLSAQSIQDKQYNKQIALFVGYDFVRKGGDVLLEAWQQVQRSLPNAELWIVGAKRRGRPLQPGVKWLGRVNDRAALADIYAQATVFVMPSLFEPWGHVFFEAMGFGLSCITTNHGAQPEIVADQRTGLLVPPSATVPLADALITLLSDPSRAEAMGRAAHADVLLGRTWDDVVARMAPHMEQIVDTPTHTLVQS